MMFFSEAREAAAAVVTAAEVAHADLHVVQRDEHGLDDTSGFDVVVELAPGGHVVGIAHQRIHVVRCREARDTAELGVLVDGAQLVRAALTDASTERCVATALGGRRSAVPLRDGHGARRQNVQGH